MGGIWSHGCVCQVWYEGRGGQSHDGRYAAQVDVPSGLNVFVPSLLVDSLGY